MAVDVLSVTLRALSFLALFQAAGIALFLALRERQLPHTEGALQRIGTLAALIATTLCLAHYALEAARMSGELGGVLDGALQGMVLHSAAGVTLSWRLLGLVLIVAGLWLGGLTGRTAAIVGTVVLLASFTFIGHTSKDAVRWLLSPVLLVHLLVVAFWYGSLLPLYLVSSREPPETAGLIVRQFSARAVWLVPVLFLAGLILAAALLPNLAALRRPYGELLLAKLSGFAVLMLLAAMNRWRFGPALERRDRAAGRRFRQVIGAEFVLLASVLCVTALMTTFFSPEG
ncbi:MAG TPA: CopD family protein [Steroidobacteraceae bacterium]